MGPLSAYASIVVRALLPRLVVVVVVAPLAFTGALFATTRLAIENADAIAAGAAAVSFAAVATAPSTQNALVRGAMILAGVAASVAYAFV
jgi:hypothetical protein